MPLGTVEALKSAVASNLGMAIVPEVSIAMHLSDFIVRPLRPSLSRTLALIEHRNKPNEPALEIVRNALLALRPVEANEPKRRSGGAPIDADLPVGQIKSTAVVPAKQGRYAVSVVVSDAV